MHIQKMIEAAECGGAVLAGYFGESLDLMEKTSAADFRTKADVESEVVILEVLRRAFPGYNVLSEESGKVDNGSEYTFIIDPMDGTNNFVIGLPNFTVSIGLMKSGRLVAGVVHVPLLKQCYCAEAGKGAFLNGQRLSVSVEKDLERATISAICGYTNYLDPRTVAMFKLRSKGLKRLLDNWSPAYDFCLLAAGKIEAVLFCGADTYDYAAGRIIAREAGARITGFDGEPVEDMNAFFLASNGPSIHEELIKSMK